MYCANVIVSQPVGGSGLGVEAVTSGAPLSESVSALMIVLSSQSSFKWPGYSSGDTVGVRVYRLGGNKYFTHCMTFNILLQPGLMMVFIKHLLHSWHRVSSSTKMFCQILQDNDTILCSESPQNQFTSRSSSFSKPTVCLECPDIK